MYLLQWYVHPLTVPYGSEKIWALKNSVKRACADSTLVVAIRSSRRYVTTCQIINGCECGCAGDIEASHGRSLPYDVQEHILGKLPLWEVAHLSATCRSFQEIFTRQVKKEVKARSDLALEHFGQERIITIAALIERFVKGETMDPAFGLPIFGWMSLDGELHIIREATWRDSRRAVRERGDVNVMIHTRYRVGDLSPIIAISWGRTQSQINLSISQRESVTIEMYVRGDENLQGVALVQALLSEGLGPTFHYDGHPVKVHIKWWVLRDADKDFVRGRGWTQVSEAALRAQIAPLMPLAPQISFRDDFLTLSFSWE